MTNELCCISLNEDVDTTVYNKRCKKPRRSSSASPRSKTFVCFEIYRNSAKILKAPVSSRDMPPILLAVFHCSLYREHISSWGGGGLISISAPPRGATGEVMHNIIVFEISIHAPPRGATRRHKRPAPARQTFQFTPLREGRHFLEV